MSKSKTVRVIFEVELSGDMPDAHEALQRWVNSVSKNCSIHGAGRRGSYGVYNFSGTIEKEKEQE